VEGRTQRKERIAQELARRFFWVWPGADAFKGPRMKKTTRHRHARHFLQAE